MNHALFRICFGVFLVLPPAVLIIRFFNQRLMPWRLFFLAVAVGGWASANATVYFYYQHLGEMLALDPNNPALLDVWAAGGTKRTFALLLGWLYGLVYSVPWLAVYALASVVREQMRKIKCSPRS